jgi:hypothetical protein
VRLGPRRREPTSTAEGLREHLLRRRRRGELRDVERGQLEGLSEAPERRARLTPQPDETVGHHGGYLVGKLLVFTEARGVVVTSDFLVPTMAAYCVGIAEAARRPGVDVRDPTMPAHTYAMVRTERKLGAPVPVEQEEHLLTWLVTAAGLRPVGDAPALLGRRRARRRAKLFPDLPPERAASPASEA